ncbi:branched-chain amino acid transport system permease protein [Rhodoligotrophos appendicifer]|uniref:branched-chain amino acid ABC transporter permease n=1 Tax=Rhodoligotrophos appendicifer TaxID=987056 RepID=UPI001184C683|nr:branched-chain amino acid ABC transporter permease [Rhodoligotrophos appendicifer]
MNELAFFINKVLVAGTIIGSIYALGAIGVTLVYSILRFAHFAHGDMMTAGAFISFLVSLFLATVGFNPPVLAVYLALPIAMVATAVLAILLDRGFYKPLRDAGAKPVVLVMASIGVMLMMQGLIRVFGGTQSRDMYITGRKEVYQIPLPLGPGRNLIITEPQLFLILFTIIAVIALHLFLTRARLGKAMRAMSDNLMLAKVSGIDTERVVWATWAIGGGLAALAGTMLALDVTLKPDLSFNILLPIFAAAIVGGIGQPYGAILGGFVVGFAETLAVFNWAILLRPFRETWIGALDLPTQIALVPTEYKLIVPFVILVMILISRPTGIMKGRVL